jgi:hypothetical protein
MRRDISQPIVPPIEALDPLQALLAGRAASGLWEQSGQDIIKTTTDALLVLLRSGVDSTHAIYGARVRKAIDALVAELDASPSSESTLVELALGTAWLLTHGPRTRRMLEAIAQKRPELLACSLAHERPRRSGARRCARERLRSASTMAADDGRPRCDDPLRRARYATSTALQLAREADGPDR